MSAYIVGNLLGRLFVSFLLVFVCTTVLAGFDPGKGWRSLWRPGPLAIVVLLFVVGLVINSQLVL